MKKRRIAATILAACLLTAAFGSCGNEGDSSTSSKATSSADSAERKAVRVERHLRRPIRSQTRILPLQAS